jgi:hypothetical protein
MAENRVATAALEILSSGDGSAARAANAALEVLSSGDGSNAFLSMLALQVISSIDENPVSAHVVGEASISIEFAPIPKRLHAAVFGEATVDVVLRVGDPYVAHVVGEANVDVAIHMPRFIAADIFGEANVEVAFAPLTGGGSYTHLGGSGNRRGIFTLSGTLSTSDFEKLVNGTTTSGDLINFGPDSGDVTGRTLVYTFNGSPRIVTGLKLYVNGGVNENYDFQGYDGSDWTTLTSLTVNGSGAIEKSFSNNTPYQTYRLIGTSGTTNGFRTWYELELKTDGTSYDAGDRTSIITVSTDLNIGIGSAGADISVSVDGITYPTDEFDDTGRWWFTGSDQEIAGKEIRFTLQQPVAIRHAYWQSGYDGVGTCGTWQWQGSNDGSTWTDLGDEFVWTTSDTYSPDDQQDLQNTTQYLIYRMLGVSGLASGALRWNEIVFDVAPVEQAVFGADVVGEANVRIIINRPPFIPFVQSVVIVASS